MTAPISQADWERQRREATEEMPRVIDEVGLPKVLLPYQARTVSLLETTACRVLFIEKSRRDRPNLGVGLICCFARRPRTGGRRHGRDVYLLLSGDDPRVYRCLCNVGSSLFYRRHVRRGVFVPGQGRGW